MIVVLTIFKIPVQMTLFQLHPNSPTGMGFHTQDGIGNKCAMQCLSTRRCRAFKITQSENSEWNCQVLNTTENIPEPVLRRIYPTPTAPGMKIEMVM